MRELRVSTPFTKEVIENLKVGDKVLISGKIYTARDEAHRRLAELIHNDEKLPYKLDSGAIYYSGPIVKQREPLIFSSAGPTTSSRMDSLTPILLLNGLKVMIGKGPRIQQVIEAMTQNGAIYLSTIGGAGVLLATKIKQAKIIAFPELGAEAIYELTVEDFPCYLAIDSKGNSIYEKNI